MGLEHNACSKCGKRGGLTKVTEFDGQDLPGSFCRKCGFFIADHRSERFDVRCGDCDKPMGTASVQVPVTHMGPVPKEKGAERAVTVIHKGEQRKTYMCPGCSKRRVEKGGHDVDEVLTRYPVYCLGGCGALQAYNDHPEGTEDINPTRLICPTCTPKAIAVAESNVAIDKIVKDVSGPGG